MYSCDYFLIVFVCTFLRPWYILKPNIHILKQMSLKKHLPFKTTSFELTQHVFSNIFFNLVWFTRYPYKKLHFDCSQHEKAQSMIDCLFLEICFNHFSDKL